MYVQGEKWPNRRGPHDNGSLPLTDGDFKLDRSDARKEGRFVGRLFATPYTVDALRSNTLCACSDRY